MKVRITRQPKDYNKIGEINPEKIKNVRWDNISGGYEAKYGFYQLYGYIDYEDAMELVDCSGEHESLGRRAKICIVENLNKEMPYIEGYQYLLSQVLSKPKSKIAQNRPQGYPPCTKYILQVLDEYGSLTRKELREKLTKDFGNKEKGYALGTIRRALFELVKSERVSISDEKNHNQQIVTKLNR